MKAILYYGWCTGCGLLAINIFVAYLLGFESLEQFWGIAP